MTRSRLGLIGVAVVALWAGTMVPAQAHATFVEATAPPDSEEVLDLNVPVEVEGAHNAEITVEVPTGFEALYCYAEPGWSCAAEAPSDTAPARFTWTRTAAAPADTDNPSFGTQTAKKPGDYPFVVHQKYSDGTVVSWAGPPGSANPAPVLRIERGAHHQPSRSEPLLNIAGY